MKAILEQYYGLTHTRLKKMEGYASINYRVDSDQGRFVLKLYPYSEAQENLLLAKSEMMESLGRPAAHTFPCPIRNNRQEVLTLLEIDGKKTLFRLLSFIEGRLFAKAFHSPALFRSLGEFMAKLDNKLLDFRNPVIEARRLEWDLQHLNLSRNLSVHISDPPGRKIVEYFFLQWDEHVYPVLHRLRRSVIHNDANDWNILVHDGQVSGIIDFGDTAYTPLIHELAIAITYAVFKKDDPLRWSAYIIEGFHRYLPLEKQELDILYYLIAGRLIMSVCRSAYEKKLNPGNEYITISEQPAWRLLEKWVRINPLHAKNIFYRAAGQKTEGPMPTVTLLEKRYQVVSPILSVSYKQPIHMESAAFQYMFDHAGHTFLDAYNNIPHVGHQHPRVVEAGRSQIAKLNTNTRYLYDSLHEYAEALLAKFPKTLNKVYFVNSGSAASDLAIRLAQSYTGNTHIVAIEHGYHGNTCTGIEISPYKYNNPGGKGRAGHIIQAPLPDTYRGAFKAKNDTSGKAYARQAIDLIKQGETPVAGFIAEPIVGCGGQVPLAPGYLKALYPFIRDCGGVCISDEVQTGFGRTGSHFWGYEMQGVVPDIVVLGKPMGNGHPMGAVVTTGPIAEAFHNGMEFFSSFGGNPVSCEIGKAVLHVISEESLQENALIVGNYLMSMLKTMQQEFDVIGDVRGSGLFIGIEFILGKNLEPNPELAAFVKNELRNRYIMVSTDGPYNHVIKSKPPLCFTKANAEQLVEEMRNILKLKY